MPNAQLAGNSYTIIAPGEVVSKNIEMLNDGTSTLVVTYDEGTVVETTLNPVDGSVNIKVNKAVTVDEDQKTIEITKE